MLKTQAHISKHFYISLFIIHNKIMEKLVKQWFGQSWELHNELGQVLSTT